MDTSPSDSPAGGGVHPSAGDTTSPPRGPAEKIQRSVGSQPRGGELEPQRFYLDRAADITGVSGAGRVADGVVWPDGTVTIRWRGARPSTVNWERLEHAEAVHGHGGATRFVWMEDPHE